jgi:2-keto-3-deoxy-L-rhamnonate aldolase RhmA
MDLQRASDLRASIRDGNPVVGGWVSIGHPAVAEITAGAGPDFVVVDAEHGELDLGDVPTAIRAIEAGGDAVPFVRVPSVDPAAIKRALDAGAAGIMVPRVDDAADAERVVAATTYPPAGVRGTAGARTSRYGQDLAAHVADADEAVTRFVQVETERAVDNAAAIAAVEGIDALFVGPADLSTALDVPLDYDAEPFRAAVREVVDAAEEAGVRTGIFVTDPDRIDDWLALGFDFAVVGYDAAFLRSGTEELVSAFRSATEE